MNKKRSFLDTWNLTGWLILLLYLLFLVYPLFRVLRQSVAKSELKMLIPYGYQVDGNNNPVIPMFLDYDENGNVMVPSGFLLSEDESHLMIPKKGSEGEYIELPSDVEEYDENDEPVVPVGFALNEDGWLVLPAKVSYDENRNPIVPEGFSVNSEGKLLIPAQPEYDESGKAIIPDCISLDKDGNWVIPSVVETEKDGLTLEHFKKFFGDRYYFSTLFNSFKVSIAVMFFSLLIGIPLAYYYNLYKIRGARFLQIIIILCSMSAPFIGAYSWILLLGRNGFITKIVYSIFKVQLPPIYGFRGIVVALTCRMFPMVFLYVQGALRSIDNTLLEASYNLGSNEMSRFWRVIMPLCMPSTLAAALLVFMRAMGDFGTPLLIGEGYRTFPVEIYNQFLGETSRNYNFASAIAVVAIFITAAIFILQKVVANRYRFTINAMHTIEPKQAKGVKNFLIHFLSYLVVFVAMAPQLYLVLVSFRHTNGTGEVFLDGYSLHSYELAFKKHIPSIFNTFRLGIVSVALVIALAVLVAYLVVRRSSMKVQMIDTLSMVPYIIPGSVVGIALISAFNNPHFALTGTMAILVVSMMIRRLPYTIRSSVAILGQIPISVEEAARSLGTSQMGSFWKITFPMMSNGIISGGLLSWITIITEMSSSIMLYSAHTTTLTVATYIYVSRGADGPASALAVILSILTFMSLWIFMKVSKNKNMTM